MSIFVSEWLGVFNRSCNFERPLVFFHFILAKALGIRWARYYRSRISRRMDLWERGVHAGLVGVAEAEG